MPKVVVAFDKFRGSSTAADMVGGVSGGLTRAGHVVVGVPLADGGEGSLEVLGGPNKFVAVSDPLGRPVEAGYRLDGRDAFIEMSTASGLALVGGAAGNDPVAADTFGTGQLIAHAIELGARRIHVLLGGSATTDGGWGALAAMPPAARLKEIELTIGCDVRTLFTKAAVVFGPQKGASSAQVELLTRRLERLVQVYRDTYGRDVSSVAGGGAAGGLAGGLVAVGGRIESGFDVLAELVGLDEMLRDADLVITGEGLLDGESFNGKVVGGVASWAAEFDVPVLAIVGAIDADGCSPEGLVGTSGATRCQGIDVVSLTDRFGLAASLARPVELATEVALAYLAG